MKLNRKTVLAISVLVSVALIGLLAVQIILLVQTARLKKQAFDQNVYGFQKSVVQKLEDLETWNMVLRTSVGLDETGTYSYTTMNIVDHKNSEQQEKWVLRNLRHFNSSVQIDSNKVILHLRRKECVRLVHVDKFKRITSTYMDTTLHPGIHPIPIDQVGDEQMVDVAVYVGDKPYYVALDKSSPGRLVIDPAMDEMRRQMINRVLDQYMVFEPVPITERIGFAKLDSIVQAAAKDYWMPKWFVYGIHALEEDSILFANLDGFDERLLHSKYQTPLYPNDLTMKPNDLAVYFPNQNFFLLKQLGLSSLIALLFIAVLLATFVILIRTLLSQKRFAQSMIDFINNMTHEFKTPISTIALAGETIRTDPILKDRERLIKYGDIIHDESMRMKKQVEKILDMAALEKGDVELRFESVDLHALIRQAADHFRLIVEKQKGTVDLHLEAADARIEADKIHLMNVLHNLLDNAVKYSKTRPEIRISTSRQDGWFRVDIADNGIGVRPEHQKRIFDKYYRVPTGNVHNVKGFGLGLSYVKLILEAHGGRIDVESAPGSGSTFYFVLPLGRTINSRSADGQIL